jgi:hypothetical protein
MCGVGSEMNLFDDDEEVELSKEQQELLERLMKEITNLATEVVQDYEINPSEMSGSITEVHIDSPILEHEQPIEDQATKDRKRWGG